MLPPPTKVEFPLQDENNIAAPGTSLTHFGRMSMARAMGGYIYMPWTGGPFKPGFWLEWGRSPRVSFHPE
jgi:hypothetical protein